MTTTPLRWSSARDCPRKAALQATTEPDRDWTDREQRILYRGRSLGRDYADWLEAKYGAEHVEREVKVEWPLGIGHIDVFLVPTMTAFEVLSSAHASDAMVHSKLLQLVGYMEHYPRAANGCLVVLNPSDFAEERFPVSRESSAYDRLVDEVRERIATLHHWRATGGLPGRVCRRPSESIGHFCRHSRTCFDGWEEPEPIVASNDPAIVALASGLHAAKHREREYKALLTDAEGKRKEAEALLADHLNGDTPREGVRFGPYVVKRTHVQRKPTLDIRKAELAGALNVEALGEFMRPGADYWTTAIEKTDLEWVSDVGDEVPF